MACVASLLLVPYVDDRALTGQTTLSPDTSLHHPAEPSVTPVCRLLGLPPGRSVQILSLHPDMRRLKVQFRALLCDPAMTSVIIIARNDGGVVLSAVTAAKRSITHGTCG